MGIQIKMAGKNKAAKIDDPNIICDNPEKFYEFEGTEIGFGKMARVSKVKSKKDGKDYAAKCIYFDDDVAFIIRQLCEILAALHKENIVHLDLRPTNIRFEGRDIKLLATFIAHCLEDPPLLPAGCS